MGIEDDQNGEGNMGKGPDFFKDLEAELTQDDEPVRTLAERTDHRRLGIEYQNAVDATTMNALEKLGAYMLVAEVGPDEVDEYWDKNGPDLEAHGVQAPDGTVTSYRIYRQFPEIIAGKKDEVDRVLLAGQILLSREVQTVDAEIDKIYDEEVAAGRLVPLGDMTADEFQAYKAANPRFKLERKLRYDGSGKARVFRAADMA